MPRCDRDVLVKSREPPDCLTGRQWAASIGRLVAGFRRLDHAPRNAPRRRSHRRCGPRRRASAAGAGRTPPPACRSRGASRAGGVPWWAIDRSRSPRPPAPFGRGARQPRTSRSPGHARSSRRCRQRGRRRQSGPASRRSAIRAAIPAIAAARSGALVGQPRWSATTRSWAIALADGQHGADEILAARRIDPGGPQNDRARAGRQHRLFAGQLACAIHALRRGRIGLDVGRPLSPSNT